MNQPSQRGGRSGKAVAGFSLVEVVIAIAIIGITFIGLIGLLGLGVVTDQASSQQTVGTSIAASILADLRNTPAFSSTSSRYGLTLTSTSGTSPAVFGSSPSYYLYFDNSATFLPLSAPTAYTTAQSPAPAGAVYVAAVYLTQVVASVGPTTTPKSAQTNWMARVVVSWSAQAKSSPAGNVDVIVQFLTH